MIPIVLIAITCVATKEITASASVVLKSLVAALRSGINSFSFPPVRLLKNPMVPKPGRSPKIFEKKIKMKKLVTQGNILLTFFPETWEVRV